MSFFMTGPPSRVGAARQRAIVGLFSDAGRFATTRTQVVQLGAPHPAAPHDGDRLDVGGIERENAFHTFTKGNLAHREGPGDAAPVLAGNADAFEVLYAAAGALGHLVADTDGVTGLEVRDGFSQLGDLFRLELCDQVHLIFSYMARGWSTKVRARQSSVSSSGSARWRPPEVTQHSLSMLLCRPAPGAEESGACAITKQARTTRKSPGPLPYSPGARPVQPFSGISPV